MVFKESPSCLPTFKELAKNMKKIDINFVTVNKLRRQFKRDVYTEYEEKHYKGVDSRILRNKHEEHSDLKETIVGKFLSKFYLYTGFSKLRSIQSTPSNILDKFEEEVVAGNYCDLSWPICIYYIFYKNKMQRHYSFQTK